MRPAFSSTKQAAAFALLLLVVLLSPVLAGKKVLPPREQAYASLGWNTGPYPYIQQQIFEEKGPIDILFIGSSHILFCLDARRLQVELSRQLGRPATVRVLGWGGAGYDALYFTTKDVFEHRQVKLLVFYDDHNGNYRSSKASVWFRFPDDARALAGLPLPEQSYFYFAAMAGMPRNLLCLVRPNLPADLQVQNYWQEHYGTINLTANLGSTTPELGFSATPHVDADPSVPYIPFSVTNNITPGEACIYSALTRTNYEFATDPLPAWEVHFMSLFANLAAQHRCQLVLLHIPVIDESHAPRIQERAFWPERFGTNLAMLGVPPARMFNGLSDDEIRRLYVNPTHLNKNGQIYFTSLILPSLLELYDTTSKP
jgi:hypothetical protein